VARDGVDFMRDYSASDMGSTRARRGAFYDALRRTGMPRANAAKVARDAAEHGISQDQSRPARGTPHVSRAVSQGEAGSGDPHKPFGWLKLP